MTSAEGQRGRGNRDPAAKEPQRVERTYARYHASPRKQRSWSAENPGNAAIRAELVQAVCDLAGFELRSAAEVLDIGCGSGWWLERLAGWPETKARLHGVELLPERAVQAQRRAPTAEVIVADARNLPYPDRRFRVVSLFTVLSSLAGTGAAQAALREAWRILASPGVLLVWEPRLPNPMNRATHLITLRALRNALPSAAIDGRTTTVVPALARHLGDRTAVLYPRLGRLPALRTHRLVAARQAPSRPQGERPLAGSI